jgi:uncharacterized protein YqgV (UPF0045/DUF77 family)
MSVLLEFAMFPTDKGTSVSAYVSKVIDMIRFSGAIIIQTANLPFHAERKSPR